MSVGPAAFTKTVFVLGACKYLHLLMETLVAQIFRVTMLMTVYLPDILLKMYISVYVIFSLKMSGFLDNCQWPRCECIELGERRNMVAAIVSGVLVRIVARKFTTCVLSCPESLMNERFLKFIISS